MRDLRANGQGTWVVQKYGGTSVGKFLDNIGSKIVPSYLDQGHRVALVCSARSGKTKSTGTTNLLLQAAAQALRPSNGTPPVVTAITQSDIRAGRASRPETPAREGPNPLALSQILQRGASLPRRLSDAADASPAGTPLLNRSVSSLRTLDEDAGATSAFDATVEMIREQHILAAKETIRNPEILEALLEDLEYDCDRLRSFLLAAQILDEISPRSKDVIVGVGEKLSCRIVAASLIDRGIDSELVTLDAIVERAAEDAEQQPHASATQLQQAFYDKLSARLGERLNACEGRVPVVTGFFGVVPGSLLSQIGRGYTDLCAALCAVGTSAAELQVWKEVDGIFTADPRKVPTARLLNVVTPEEAAELTYYGSEVIHPFTMEQVIRASIPIRIKNVMNPTGMGTVIFPDSSTPTSSAASTPSSTATPNLPSVAFMHVNGYHGPNQARKLPTAVTIKDQIVVINIRSNRKTISHGFFARIFGILDRHGIIVDLISTSEVHVSMALHAGIRRGLLDKVVGELKAIGDVLLLKDMAILSLVGKSMKNMVGIAGKMFSTLANGNVNIEMISQGASEINISCVIANRDSAKALNLVHHNLLSLAAPLSGQNHAGPWLF